MSDVEGLSSDGIRRRLRALGLSRGAIDAAWPGWWQPDADGSASARTELAFAVSRRLGLDPRTVVRPAARIAFRSVPGAAFKHLAGETDLERAGIVSFGQAVARTAIAGSPDPQFQLVGQDSAAIRAAMVGRGQTTVALEDLIALSWAAGVPVLQLRVFPWNRKRMSAMVVRARGRFAILVAKESSFPAAIAFYLGHELGHVALGHLNQGTALVDLDDDNRPRDGSDRDEAAADAFALELLTGEGRPEVVPAGPARSGRELARIAQRYAGVWGIEAGVVAEVYGFSTGEWDIANDALRRIYPHAQPLWQRINAVAREQLDFDAMPPDGAEFLESVLGIRDRS